MNEDTLRKFIGIVRSEKVADEAKERILTAVLTAAGFKVVAVATGIEKGYNRDQDGSALDSYTANPLSGIVVKEKRSDSNRATHWLEAFWRETRRLTETTDLNDDAIVDKLLLEIERSVPLEPILLTEYGESLREYPPNGAFGNHARDDHEIGITAGIHDICDCWVDKKKVSETHNMLHCRGCGLRVVFPKKIKTYGALRQYFLAQLKAR